VTGRNADGGWGYYKGKASRIEPTCWARLALGAAHDETQVRDAAAWLSQRQQPSGWLVENSEWPINIAFNALAAFTLLAHRDQVAEDVRNRLLAAVVASKGTAAPPSDNMRQDNSLQGWSWIDATFSWVEPTCWGLLALKRWGQTLGSDPGVRPGGQTRGSDPGVRPQGLTPALARIAEAERLLIDRSCRPGGWNFGNATVMQQDLRAYAPTTALGLLAMQDRRGEDAVVRGLRALETLWTEEISATSLGLSLICFDVYGQPLDHLAARLAAHAEHAVTFGNHHGIAVALFALASVSQPHAFRL